MDIKIKALVPFIKIINQLRESDSFSENSGKFYCVRFVIRNL